MIWNNNTTLILSLLLLLRSGMAHASTISCYHLVDKQTSHDEAIPDIAARTTKEIPCETNSFGFSTDVHWFKVKLNGHGSFLEISYPSLSQLSLWSYDQGSWSQDRTTGNQFDSQSRYAQTRNFVFPLKHGTKELLIRVHTAGSVQVPIRVHSESSILSEMTLQTLLFGIYYGIMIGMMAYNLFLFFIVRKKVHLLYVLYISCYTIFQFSYNGFAAIYLWPTTPKLNQYSVPVFVSLMFLFLIEFSRSYLVEGARKGVYGYLFSSLGLVAAALTAASLFVNYSIIINIVVFYTIVAACSLWLIAAVQAATMRTHHAVFYLVAWTSFLLGIVVSSLKNFGLVESKFIFNYGMQIGSAIEAILLSMGLGYKIKTLEVLKHKAEIDLQLARQEATRNESVALMTQMLAHDVRKPFSILRVGLNLLESARDANALRSTLAKLRPEVEKAAKSVDGLINDVMEIGTNKSTLIQDPKSPEALVSMAIEDLCRTHPQAAINFSYKFEHQREAYVDIQKVGRVFSNILGNAVQAMNGRGDIWFRTRQCGNFIEFCVGNSGSLIAKENLPKLFDAFFTSGKRGGTGLGLAIAHKVVTAHGGTIRCVSSKTMQHVNGMVEFYFTLPASSKGERQEPAICLPLSTQEAIRHTSLWSEVCDWALESATYDTRQSVEARAHGQQRAVRPEVAIIEDNPFVLQAWTEALASEVTVHTANSPESFMQLLATDQGLLGRLSLVITDYYFENSPQNGADLGQLIKKCSPRLQIVLASDGVFPSPSENWPIDKIIPKEPLPYADLLASIK